MLDAQKKNLDLKAQIIAFHIILLFASQQVKAGATPEQLADRIGCTQSQIETVIDSLAVRFVLRANKMGEGFNLDILIDALEEKGKAIYREITGWCSGDHRVDCDWRLMPLAAWESFTSHLLPDAWRLEWARDLWDLHGLKQWLLECGAPGAARAKALLAVLDEECVSLRRPMYAIGHGWGDLVSEDLSTVLPGSIRSALGLTDNGSGTTSDLPWLSLQNRSSRGVWQLQTAMDILASGGIPSFSVDGIAWSVWRIRRFHGHWMLDSQSDVGEVRAWSPSELSAHLQIVRADMVQDERPVTAADVEVMPMWLDCATAEGQVDHPGCMHLGSQRDEVILLDYSEVPWPSFHDSLVGAEILYGDGPHDPGVYRRPDDLPEDWMTRRIYPRFNRQSPVDPAWVEFVSILLPYAGRIRLRVPGHPEIESDRMLAFCTGSIGEITRSSEDK
jgi:hypothetical protein